MANSILAFSPRDGGGSPAPLVLQSPPAALAGQALLGRRCARLASRLDLSDRVVRQRLIDRLERTARPRMTWLLLALLERGRSYASEGAARFAACARLAEAEQPFARYAAYRWLAQLHTVDLRCENSAKRTLGAALKREQGIAARRIQQLLRAC